MVQKHNYGVTIDAGSSGSRLYVYEYKTAEYVKDEDDKEELARLPKVKSKKHWHHKVHHAIATYGETPELVGPQHLKDLVEFAEEIVPEDAFAETPIFVQATAGMRLLPKSQQNALLESICTYLQTHSKFQLPDCDGHVQIISGETEGVYGWIAANYLLGGFDKGENFAHGNEHHTYGFLDMGGASAQIAFAPNATEAEKHANDLTLLRLRKVNGEAMEYGIFVTTWLGFGVNQARRRYVKQLLDGSPTKQNEVPDPCLPHGLRIEPTGGEIDPSSKQTHLLGTGNFTTCLQHTYPLLEKDAHCADPPCLLHGVHTPALDFDVNHFVGVSEYWHTTHEVFGMAHKDRAYDFQAYQREVVALCERDWAGIEADVAKEKWGHKVDETKVEEVCFKASWLINMLHEGIGIPRVGLEEGKEGLGRLKNKSSEVLDPEDRGFLDPFQAVDKIDGTELSWTLGKMLLYASSQMPAAKGAMAVGFGSNVPGSKELPPDFKHPSGLQEGSGKATSGGKDWQDRILSSSYTRRIPGILIFLLILALAAYLLCGRERRQNFWYKISGRRRHSPSSFRPRRRKAGGGGGLLGGKFFSHAEPSYERVLEDAADPDDFELSDVEHYSDSSGGDNNPPRNGRTSGWATPATRGMSPDVLRSSPKKHGYFDSTSSTSSSGSTANGLGITPFERGGLIGRVESKERLAPNANSLGRIRTGSPRRSPLISPLKESVD